MPAATTTTTVAPEPPQAQVWYKPTGDKVLEPFSSPLVAAEHKIRNLEKRKQKLDQYRTEQADGKTLNADQLAAVAKYNEVIQQLEFNRELVSCLRQVHQQTIKFIKQELRREVTERNKFLLALLAGLDQLQNTSVQHDFLFGENGAQKLNNDDLYQLTELNKVLKPSLRDQDFSSKLEAGSEVIVKLFEPRGKVNNRPSQQVRALIDTVVESQYFTTGPVSPSSVPIDITEDVSVLQSQDAPTTVHVPEIPIGNSNPVSAQMMLTQDRHDNMQFSFIQDSQLEIESPHMDPAVVAVSSHVPPQPPQIQTQPDSNHMFVSVQAPPTEDLTSIQSGMRDLNVNHNNMNSNNVQEEDNKWDATTHNFSTTNGNVEGGEDNTNGFDRSGRGAYKGRGGGRGRGGFGARGNSRPPKGGSRGGFNNSNKNRFGRVERIGQSDAEISEFRGKGRGFPRSYRGNGISTGGPVPPMRRNVRPASNSPQKPFNNGTLEPRPSE